MCRSLWSLSLCLGPVVRAGAVPLSLPSRPRLRRPLASHTLCLCISLSLSLSVSVSLPLSLAASRSVCRSLSFSLLVCVFLPPSVRFPATRPRCAPSSPAKPVSAKHFVSHVPTVGIPILYMYSGIYLHSQSHQLANLTRATQQCRQWPQARAQSQSHHESRPL